MNGQQLYDTMKDALNFFGLSFMEMEKMEVTFLVGKIIFSYKGSSITINVED